MEESKSVRDDLWIDNKMNGEQEGADGTGAFVALPVATYEELVQRLQESEARYKEHLFVSESRFRIIFEHAAVGISYVSPDGRWLQVNQKFCDIIGYSSEELLERTFQEMTHPDDLEETLATSRRLLNGEIESHSVEKRYVRKDGGYVWVHVTISAVRDSMGATQYLIAVIEDISERKRVEKEAIAHARQLEAVFEAMTDLLVVYDSNGRILYASRSAQELFPLDMQPDYYMRPHEERLHGYASRSERGQPLTREQWPLQRLLGGEVLNGDQAIDVLLSGADGREIQFSVSGSPMHDADGHIVGCVVIAHDVTQRRRLERRTQNALEGLLAMAESLVMLPETSEGMGVIGRRLAELTCSVLDCQRVGLQVVESVDEVLRPVAVVGLSDEQERSWWIEQQQESSLSNNPHPELVATLRAGEIIVLDLTQPPFDAQPNPYNIKVMLVAPMCIGDRLVGLVTLDYGDEGHTYTREELVLASAVAKLAALVVERQRLLHERAESQGREMALSEANRRMEEFLGIASHELRTPLTTIKANIQLALRRLKGLVQPSNDVSSAVSEKAGAAQAMLTRAERQVGVLNRLVGDLIDISRIQTGKLQLHLRHEPSDLAEIVQETVQEQRKTTPGRIIQLRLPGHASVPVIVDPDRIAQVLSNYLSNGLKYSLAEKPIEVSLEMSGGEARVAVRDEGPGLSPAEQERIWQCFYQAEEIKVLSGSGVGLGLGLYISQTIITRHDGRVGVDSVRGEGSTFWFTLPLVQPATTGEQGYEAS